MPVKKDPKKSQSKSAGESPAPKARRSTAAKKSAAPATLHTAGGAKLVKQAAPPLVPRDAEVAPPPPAVERQRYDGDSAIKLYLREIEIGRAHV